VVPAHCEHANGALAPAVFKQRAAGRDKNVMSLPRNQKLRQKASLAMRTGDHAGALEIYSELERLDPDDPTWPERCAGAHHELGQADEEVACLRRSLALLVAQEQVLPAIATCKLILDVRPDDPETLDCLHLLYGESQLTERPSDRAATRALNRRPLPDEDAPLEELELTDAIHDARALDLGRREPSGVVEIPLEESRSGPTDLRDLDVDIVDEVHAAGARSAVAAGAPAGRESSRKGAATDPRARAAREELARTPLFGSLDVETLQRLVAKVRVVRLGAGEVLFRQGDPADTLYVVVDGAVVPIAEGSPRTRMAVLEHGEFFGEIGLVTNQPRTATIEALVDTRLLAIDRPVMWSLIRNQSHVSKTLLRFLRERLIDRTMRTHPFFAPFARAELDDLPPQFRFLEVQRGAPVIEQGQSSPGLFVMLAGSMDVVDETTEKHLGRLEPGDVFGGIPLVRREAAAASAVAVEKCWVLVLEEARLRRILAGRPRLEDDLLARTNAASSVRSIL
jgi:CRP-like cAMP-binding protein